MKAGVGVEMEFTQRQKRNKKEERREEEREKFTCGLLVLRPLERLASHDGHGSYMGARG